MNKTTSLKQLQRNFINDCLSPRLNNENCLLELDVDTSRISAQGLLTIYRNSAIANITQSLTLTYPVIDKLVGRVFFQATCQRYIYLHWPQSGNMDDYGEEFALFLSEFEHTKTLVYLSEIARLEWAFHQSSLANDADSTDWSLLSLVEDISKLKFTLAPSLKLISSTYAIDEIWQNNQDNIAPDTENEFIDIDKSKSTFLLLFRKGLKTVVMSVSEGEYTLIESFNHELIFEQAIMLAIAKQPDLSIDDCLQKFIELEVISGFFIKGKKNPTQIGENYP